MNATPMNTAATGSVTAAVVTLISAFVSHYKIDLPADAQISLAVGIVSGAHYIGNKLAARAAAKVAAPAAPVA
jgi:hypothetical protein